MERSLLLLLIAMFLVGSVAVGMITFNELYKRVVPRSCEDFLRVGYVWLPKEVARFFNGDVIRLNFTNIYGDNFVVDGMVVSTEGAQGIYYLNCKGTWRYDYMVSMSDVVAIQLATSLSPVSDFKRFWRSGEIKITPATEQHRVKLLLADELIVEDKEPVPERIRELFGRFIE